MSFAPATILAVRALFRVHVPQLTPVALGIVGDDSHAASGTSYHLGKDALKSSSYSIIESSRDRAGLSNAAAALDVGDFTITVKGKKHDLRDFSRWLVEECTSGAADTRDIREVIYSLDGKNVKRWDRLGRRTTGDSSHRTHTHISWFRDSENRDKTSVVRRWFESIGAIEKEDDVSQADVIAALKSDAGKAAIVAALRSWTEPDPSPNAKPNTEARVGGWLRWQETRAYERHQAVVKLLTGVDVDETAIVAGVLSGLSPEKIAAAIPSDLAERVVQVLGERISGKGA